MVIRMLFGMEKYKEQELCNAVCPPGFTWYLHAPIYCNLRKGHEADGLGHSYTEGNMTFFFCELDGSQQTNCQIE